MSQAVKSNAWRMASSEPSIASILYASTSTTDNESIDVSERPSEGADTLQCIGEIVYVSPAARD